MRVTRSLLRLLRQGAAWFAVFLAVIAVGGFLFAWSGLYSVGASRGHWAMVSAILEFGMRSSVRTHALLIEEPELDAQALIERGAAHYQGGCQPCHGAPGRPPNPIVQATLPAPPDLGASVSTWRPRELFWIVKNGLKYTGMPGWAASERDDEVWAVVAFLRRLPLIGGDEYARLANLESRAPRTPAVSLAQSGPAGSGLASCSRCHGLDGAGRNSGAFPRLDIQTADYLFAQLQAYAAGRRASGIMQPVAAELDPSEMRRLAEFYSAQRPAVAPAAAASGNLSPSLGRTVATVGLPERDVPACDSCHAADPAQRHAHHPSLAGQYANYTAEQLQLFKAGKRRATPGARIMSVIAERLTGEQIDAVSAYLAGVSPRIAERPAQ